MAENYLYISYIEKVFLNLICRIYSTIRRLPTLNTAALKARGKLAAYHVESAKASVESSNTYDSCMETQAERLLNTYGNAILRLAYSYLHNMSDAEEILQDTLIQVLKAAPVFESSAHEKAWLLKVASNLSKNRIEYNKLRATDELDESLVQEERNDLSFVWNAVKELPVNYREMIHLFYQEGYSTKEIAAILKRKESSVRSDLHRGRERLKSILKEEYDFEQSI